MQQRNRVFYRNARIHFGVDNPQCDRTGDVGASIFKLFRPLTFADLKRETPTHVWVMHRPDKNDRSVLGFARAKVETIERSSSRVIVTYKGPYESGTRQTASGTIDAGLYFLPDETALEPLIDRAEGKATNVMA